MTNRTKAIASLAGVFLLGALCGSLVLGLFVQGQVRDRDRLKDPNGFREYFADQLSLSEAQKDSMQTELERAYQQMADIRYQVDQEYRQVFDTLSARLSPVLNAKQQQRLAQERKRLLPEPSPVTDPVLSESAVLFSLEEIDKQIAQTPRLRDDSRGDDQGPSLETNNEDANSEIDGPESAPSEPSDEELLDEEVVPGDSVFHSAPERNSFRALLVL